MYKAKIKHYNTWVIGDHVPWAGNNYLCPEPEEVYEIDSETLCKYADATYDSKDGLICEHDIIKFTVKGKKYYGHVMQDIFGEFWVRCFNLRNGMFALSSLYDKEPAGNIFDNPDILYSEIS